ncbi:ATP/GTP-binding protein [Streptomyces sp. NBC_01214]|uniref:ATP/GTP-binding protein n=1 Tax=Streptomyces sp. NBC_01214 TaxID=2903777 RepID=UPI002251B3D1|nr:ATP/GTP-binding protein [Streptomyces sp. NBC_01214]MCX4808919.1 ATP/GTP-binding protein [Streptomyces sp. NBC_01214]
MGWFLTGRCSLVSLERCAMSFPEPSGGAGLMLPATTLQGWQALLDRVVVPPDLDTCPPAGSHLGPDDVRIRYHATMHTVQTPVLKRAVAVARRLWLASSPRSEGPLDLAIDGPGETGMTTVLRQIGRIYEGIVRAQLPPGTQKRIPVIHINTPLAPGSKLDMSIPFAEFLGHRHTKDPESGQRSTDMTGPVCHVIKACGTRLVLVDGIDRLDNSELKTAFDYFGYLAAECNVSFVYCGPGSREVVNEARRGKRPGPAGPGSGGVPTLAVQPLPYSTDDYELFHEVIKAFDQGLRLRQHTPGDLLNLAAHLHRRTGGYMKPLSHLICQSAQEAIETGIEAITSELLDNQLVGVFEEDPILQF